MKKVEQITKDSQVLLDYDKPVSLSEVRTLLAKWFSEVGGNRNPFKVAYNGHYINICVKSVSYLGHPHPIYKKRIQIPKEWRKVLQNDNTLLLGIYRYKKNIVLVVFDKAKYKNNQLNNSSAHVYTLDIQKAIEFGIFSKTDNNGNKITTCREDCFTTFLDGFVKGQSPDLPVEIDFLDKFATSVPREWLGKSCYSKMFADDYRNAAQPEWPAFYLEYLFEKYSSDNSYTRKICVFVSNKSASGLDFDLNFHNAFLGDLKCHSDKSATILGNDKLSVNEAIKQYGKLWYIVFSHSTEKDSAHGHIVTKFWNRLLNARNGAFKKKDELSYGEKMKYSVRHNTFLILEINAANKKYVADFNQGMQPSGEARATKISIPEKAINNFLIYSKRFQQLGDGG